jgi:hypothetical protein
MPRTRAFGFHAPGINTRDAGGMLVARLMTTSCPDTTRRS